jgi:peptide/nickel transport system ATP-binding protein
MIYQEPMASLNPAMKIGAQLAEVPMIHEGHAPGEAWALARQIVADVRLPDPDRILRAYPHQLSGGQQQRIVIAMALMSKPALLILDEPTTALDVTVEAGIVDLVKDLGEKYGTSMLFISHNLGLVLDVCDRLCVMYSGEAVERAAWRRVRPHAPPLYAGAVPVDPAARRRQEQPPADRHSRQLPPAPRTPQGLQLRPALQLFQAGRCDAADVPMFAAGRGHDRHATRCLRFRRDRLGAPPAAAKVTEKTPVGDVVLRMEDLRKYYEVSDRPVRRRGAPRWSRPTNAQLRGPRGRDAGHRGRKRLRQVHLRQGADGAGNRDLGQDHAVRRHPGHADRKAGHRHVSVGADGVPEPLRHAEPLDDRGPPDHPRAGDLRQGASPMPSGEARMLELLDLVKLPRAFADRMPRQLSGGQKQRVGIARAFAGGAKVVVADEPVSALDVSACRRR